ncbi:hypothetical protein JW960_06770 [candidate division KSB1 bacterium]|nr:hypothetical protein [candidate division KSB1 bacterium]
MKYVKWMLAAFILQFLCLTTIGMSTENVNLFTPDNKLIQMQGRINCAKPLRPEISNAGAYIRFNFSGTSCALLLDDQNLWGTNYNYISVVIDNQYKGRVKVTKDQHYYSIASDLADSIHSVIVCKATESQNGYIAFLGIVCKQLLASPPLPKRKIEFIGNSITCGMGDDTKEIPCGTGQWFDQHNAWFAYGPRVARALNADYILNSVSGIGMTRNWNSEGPTMPNVYDNLFLNTDSTLKYDPTRFQPDLISICLGTNDFSDGDNSYDRKELDSTKFVTDYIQSIKRLRARSPHAPICCLTSPATSRQKNSTLEVYLSAIVNYMQQAENDNNVYMYSFSRFFTGGCSGHPNINDHELMTKELIPFYKKVMNW